MEAMRESWTDERLDNFRGRVEERFDAVDRRFDAVERRFDEVDRQFDEVDRRFGEVDERFDQVDARLGRVEDGLDSIQRTMVHGANAMSAAMVAGFAGVMGLLATQL